MSITTSPTPPTAEERLTELELRYTLQEETLRELSDVLLSQGRELDRLRRDLELLRSRPDEAAGPAAMAAAQELEIPALLPALLDEKPPHY
jgi:uncharacterized coiled-coil protein SlyX